MTMHEKTIDLQNRLLKFMQQNLPIKSGGRVLDITDLTITEPDALNDIEKQMNMKYSKEGNLRGWLRGKIVISDEKTGKVLSRSGAHNLIPIHYMTDRGTYLINGSEKNILSQMRLKPGAYTAKLLDKNGVKTNIMFDRTQAGQYMPQIILSFNPIDMDFKVTVKSRTGDTNFNGVNFMRSMGFTDQEITRSIGNDSISDMLIDKARNTKTVNDIYKAITGKNTNEAPEKVRLAVYNYLFENATFGPAGQGVIKANLGLNVGTLTKETIWKTVQKTFAVSRNEVEPDDKDDLRYKEVFDDNDLIMEEVERDFGKFKSEATATLTNNKDIKYTDIRAFTKLGNSVDKFFSQSGLVNNAEQTNPLFIASINKRITQLGGSGGLTSDAARNEKRARNLKAMGINRIDPIETPEGGNIGLVEHLGQSAEIKNKTIVIPVLKVQNGMATDNRTNHVELDPHTEFDSVVAFFDTRYVKKDGDKITFLKKKVPARYNGKVEMVDYDKVQYIDSAPQNIFNYTANSIPFVNHDDGNRALMGTNMQRQAILLKNREIPLVSTSVNGTNKTYEDLIGEQYGKPVKAEVNGVVENIGDGTIIIKGDDGIAHKQQFYSYFPLNQSFINNDVLVKPGDRVKKGQMIAEGWQTKDGKLALGINTRIGYLPYKGFNYEDGVVVRQSVASKMATEEVITREIDVKEDWIGGRGSNAQDQFKPYVSTNRSEIFTRLDQDGIIKVGEHVKPGDILAGFLKPEKQQESYGIADLFGAVSKNGKYRYDSETIEPTSYVSGDVKRITVVPSPEPGIKQRIVITIVTSKPLKLGDKISGKHGNKGTITKILPDDEMPVAEDNKPLDIIFSPLAVPSRKNIGQLLEVGAGLIAEKTGKPIIVNNFDHTEKDRIEKKLEEIGYPDGKMRVTLKEKNPDGTITEIPVDNPITVGNMYIMKLKHKVDEKIQSRSNLEGKAPDIMTNMPSKTVGQAQGEKHNPQSLGEMEMKALQSHNAIWNLLESSTVKADGGGDTHQRVAIFNALATGKLDSLDMPATPETVTVMADTLKSLGLNVTPVNNGKEAKSFNDSFDSLAIHPMKPTEMLKMIGKNNEVLKPGINHAKVDGKDDEPVKDGLVDPRIFGEDKDPASRTKWGYIKLGTPMPNPVLLHDASFNPYVILTGIGRDKLLEMMKGKKVLIMDPEKYEGFNNMPDKKSRIEEIKKNMQEANLKPGDMIEPTKLEDLIQKHGQIFWKAGGEGIQYMLDDIDVNKELENAKSALKSASGESIDKCYKKVKTLQMLKNNNMTASDLMWHYVPVAPTYLRPVMREGNDYIITDLNKLYKKVIMSNTPIKENYENGFNMMEDANPDDAAKDTASLYKNLTDLTGRTVYKDLKTKKELNSLHSMLSGKEAIVRGKMLSKRVDFSGRSVIGVNPDLKLNEVGIPIDMAKYVYKPFILKELIDKGYANNTDEAKRTWEKSTNPEFKKVVQDVAKDRPVIINRQPSLHKFSIQAFDPIITDTQDGEAVRSIHLNPMVVTGFNADFDGDTMAIHVPITERAREEASRLMKPSENLINPTNGQMVVEIRHEMALGIYYLTLDWNKGIGNPINYGSYQQLRKDYKDGKINVRQKVTIGGKTSTAGMAMFLMLLPEKNRKFVKNGKEIDGYQHIWSSGDIQQVLIDMHKESERTNGRSLSKIQISNTIDQIKTLGFEAATRSGISIGLKDFKKIEGVQEIAKKNIEAAKKEHPQMIDAIIQGWRKTEEEIEGKLKKGEILTPDNPLQVMMASGARAKPDQIRRMMGVVGVGRDVTSKLTLPVEHSHFEGLSPQEYWLHSYDSRKGMYDRTVSTSEPGAITRQVWSAVQDVIVKEKDCGTLEGVDISKNKSTIIGRFAAETIRGQDGVIYARRNEIITEEIRNKIYKDPTIQTVHLRSPLKCKTIGGVCQKCYGAVPGTMQSPQLGTPVGVIASQAMGEPVTQMTMNTFHSGGTSSSATLGLPRIEQILNMSNDKSNEAVLAKVSGKVTNIKHGVAGTFDTVEINGTQHKVPHLDNGEAKHLRVEVGDYVSKGDFLTYGNLDDIHTEMQTKDSKFLITNASPKDMFKLMADEEGQEEALDYTQNYLTNSMDYAFAKTIGDGKIDRRHIETIIGKLTSKVKIIDPGDSSFIKGEYVDKNTADRWNADNAGPFNGLKIPVAQTKKIIGKISAETYKDKRGNILINKGEAFTRDNIPKLILAKVNEVKIVPKQIEYQIELNSKDTVVTKGHSNWLSNMGHEDVYSQIARGATYGQVDKLNDPRSRLMTGKLLNIGEGHNAPKEKANSISSKMLNLFSNMK